MVEHKYINTYPDISIIIPLYNVEKYISDCLASVAAQKYRGIIECIIVDDCGTDNSLGIAQKFIDNYKGPIKFKIISRSENGGLSIARNEGLKHAQGEYVLFLDSDDELTGSAINSLTAPLQKYRYDFVIGNYIVIGTENKMPELLLKEGIVTKQEIFDGFLVGKWYMMAWNKLCRRQFLLDKSLEFKEGLIHEDELWSFQLASLASSMFVIHDNSYIYKIRSGSITTSQKLKNKLNALQYIYFEYIRLINYHKLPVTSNLWNFLQSKLLSILIEIYKDSQTFNFDKVYEALRSRTLYIGNNIFRNGLSIKKIIRDFHLLLPIRIAVLYEKTLVAFIQKFSINKSESYKIL